MSCRLDEILPIILPPFSCMIDGEKFIFANTKEFKNNISDDYIVSQIFAEDDNVVLKLEKRQIPETKIDESWAKEYKKCMVVN